MLSNKMIAAVLRERAVKYPDSTDLDPEVVFLDGTFQIKCKPEKNAVLKVAEKFHKTKITGTRQKKDWGIHTGREPAQRIINRYKHDPDHNQFKQLLGAQ